MIASAHHQQNGQTLRKDTHQDQITKIHRICMLWGNRVWWQNIVGLCTRGTKYNVQGRASGSVGSFDEKPVGPRTSQRVGPTVATLKRYTVELPSPCPLTPYCGSSWGHPAATLTASCSTGRFPCLPFPQWCRQALEPAGRWIQQQQLPR